MSLVKIDEYRHVNPRLEDIENWTNNFTKPILIRGISSIVNSGIKIESEIKKNKGLWPKSIRASMHTASYWSSNLVETEMKRRTTSIDLNAFFDIENKNLRKSYYISYLKFIKGKFVSAKAVLDNDLDIILQKNLPFLNISNYADLTLAWISMGGTKSLLHADPLHNCFIQVIGQKKVFVLTDRQNLIFKRIFFKPHLMRFSQPYDSNGKIVKELETLDWSEIVLNPGDMLVMPFWCFHQVETPENQLNLSIANTIKPSFIDKTLSVSYWHALLIRKYYPQLVRGKRKRYMINNLTSNSIPVLNKDISVTKNISKNPDLNKSGDYFLVSSTKNRVIKLNNDNIIQFLLAVDGIKSINDILIEIELTLDYLLDDIKDLIETEIIITYNLKETEKYNMYQIFNEIS